APSLPTYLTAGAGGGNKENGADVFARACAGCHGKHGRGGMSGEREVGAINNPAFLAIISDQALRRLAITGRPDLGMPAYHGKEGRSAEFSPLSSTDVNDLVALLAYWRLGGGASAP